MAYPHKWSPISYKSSAGQRKHIGQRPMLYRWTTPPTLVLQCGIIITSGQRILTRGRGIFHRKSLLRHLTASAAGKPERWSRAYGEILTSHTQNRPFPCGNPDPISLVPPQVHIPNGTTISSAVFAELSGVTDRQTDSHSVCSNGPHIASAALWPKTVKAN